jgi:polysaccharide export outer membrane protein
MKIFATLLLSFAFVLAAQTKRPLTIDQFPNADPSSLAPLVNVSELPTTSIPNQTAEVLPSQKLGPGDLVSISVSDCPDLTKNFRVNASGFLKLPLLKEPILAAGKEPQEIEDEVQRALIKDEILVQPVVSAAVLEYRSVPVSVMGAVKRPITFQAVGSVTLLDALARAEGLTADHGAEVLISHPRAPGATGPALVQRISFNGLMVEADPALNIRLVGGEEIRVPQAGKVYVVGNVRKPGIYPIQEGSESTVFEMIAMSEGLTPYAKKQAYIYRRESGKDGRNEIQVELAKIMDRKGIDVALQANDILYIPDNKGQRLTNTIIERIVGFGTATGTGILVWH